MTQYDIARLACKVIAVWLFATLVTMSPGVAMSATAAVIELLDRGQSHFGAEESFSSAIFGLSIPFLVAIATLIAGLYLWYGAAKIAARMVDDLQEPGIPVACSRITDESALGIAVAAIGVLTFVGILRELVGDAMRIAWTHRQFQDYWDNSEWQAGLWTSIIGLAICIYLIVGSRGIANFILRARKAPNGIENAPATNSNTPTE